MDFSEAILNFSKQEIDTYVNQINTQLNDSKWKEKNKRHSDEGDVFYEFIYKGKLIEPVILTELRNRFLELGWKKLFAYRSSTKNTTFIEIYEVYIGK